MTYLTDVYKKWRKKMLSASKYDVSLGFESLKKQISALAERADVDTLRFSKLEMGIEILEKRISEIAGSTDEGRLGFSRLETGIESLKRQLSELSERKEDSTLRFSELELAHDVPEPNNVSHSKWFSYLSDRFNKPGFRVLEIGSRVVTGTNIRHLFSEAEYVGFDFYEGNNVDMVGDAHKLSSYFKNDDKFDLIFSSAVFEHFHMPWVVAKEIHKLLAIGGHVFVETHFSYSAHERPWNFFQFSDMGLRALFNSGLGFEVVEKGMSNPMNGVFAQQADKYLRGTPIAELYCHSEILCKKIREVTEFEWETLNIDQVVDNTRYPPPTT